jgi:hypothetical protein
MLTRYIYALLACILYGGMCGVTTGAAQEMKKAQEERDNAEDASAFYRARLHESGNMLQTCIHQYTEASKVEDRCHRMLKVCLRVDE